MMGFVMIGYVPPFPPTDNIETRPIFWMLKGKTKQSVISHLRINGKIVVRNEKYSQLYFIQKYDNTKNLKPYHGIFQYHLRICAILRL